MEPGGNTIPVPGLADNEELGIQHGRLYITAADMKAVFDNGLGIAKQPIVEKAEDHANVVLNATSPFIAPRLAFSMSRSSSQSSIATMNDSIFSLVSGSSMSSVVGSQEAGERFILLLLADNEFRTICQQGICFISPERFERNLRRLLKLFATDLKREAQDTQQRHAATFVGLRARNSAHRVKSILLNDDNDKCFVPPTVLPRPTIADEEDSDESDEFEADDEPDDLEILEQFIKSSNAIAALRENLKAFFFPAKDRLPDIVSTSKGEGTFRQMQEGRPIEADEAHIPTESFSELHSEQVEEPIAMIIDQKTAEFTTEDTEHAILDIPMKSRPLEPLKPAVPDADILKQNCESTEKSTPLKGKVQSAEKTTMSSMLSFGIRLEMVLFGTSYVLRKSTQPDGKKRIKWKCVSAGIKLAKQN
jgi:hypothetical protein